MNFCKFTNETRLSIEDATENSGQTYIAAVSGACAGGGYEIAVTAEHVMLIDDRRSSVSLPETPLLAVLPGTGGLTRLTDKRRVRRDRADVFCCVEEGVRGKRAVDWRLVDEVVPPSAWEAAVAKRAAEFADALRPTGRRQRHRAHAARSAKSRPTLIRYDHVQVELDRPQRRATLTLRGPAALPSTLAEIHTHGAAFWPLALARELDDAILHLRLNEPELGLLIFRTEGDPALVLAADALLETHKADWLVREIRHYLKRVLKRIDLTSRSLIALIEPGSCYAGTLAEIAFAADRSLMREGAAGHNHPATLALSPSELRRLPDEQRPDPPANPLPGRTRQRRRRARNRRRALDAEEADTLGLITERYDEIDWDDEVRVMLEERASFSA